MFLLLLLLFIAVPIVELKLLIVCGQAFGFFPSIMVILLTGIAGAELARRQGRRAMVAIMDASRRGEMPGREIMDGVIILVAGVLLITPGLLTDMAGLLLLLPPVRAGVRILLGNWCRRKFARGTVVTGRHGHTTAPAEPETIDVSAKAVEDAE